MKNIFPHNYQKGPDMNAWFNWHVPQIWKMFKLTIKEVKHTWINTEINCQAQLTQI